MGHCERNPLIRGKNHQMLTSLKKRLRRPSSSLDTLVSTSTAAGCPKRVAGSGGSPCGRAQTVLNPSGMRGPSEKGSGADSATAPKSEAVALSCDSTGGGFPLCGWTSAGACHGGSASDGLGFPRRLGFGGSPPASFHSAGSPPGHSGPTICGLPGQPVDRHSHCSCAGPGRTNPLELAAPAARFQSLLRPGTADSGEATWGSAALEARLRPWLDKNPGGAQAVTVNLRLRSTLKVSAQASPGPRCAGRSSQSPPQLDWCQFP